VTDPEFLRILIGRDGWLRVALVPLMAGSMGALDPALLGADVLARATPTDDGRLVLTEVRLTHPRLTNDVFRGFPFTRVEAALNMASVAEKIHERIAGAIDAPTGDDPVPEPDADELADPAGLYLWRFANGTIAVNVPLLMTPDLTLRPYPETKPRLRRIEPWTGKRPDEFYRQVADVFTRAKAVKGRPGPAQRIAAANHVPVTKVHRWVKEARRRGLMGAPDLADGAERLTPHDIGQRTVRRIVELFAVVDHDDPIADDLIADLRDDLVADLRAVSEKHKPARTRKPTRGRKP
jgi:hypothetical protein